MEYDCRNRWLYRPVSHNKRDCCKHNEPWNEAARDAFVEARLVQPVYLELGRSVVLVLYMDGDNTRIISTSPVEGIAEQDSVLQITTKNSVYVMALSDATRESKDGN